MDSGARIWIQILAHCLYRCMTLVSYLSSLGPNFVTFKNEYTALAGVA